MMTCIYVSCQVEASSGHSNYYGNKQECQTKKYEYICTVDWGMGISDTDWSCGLKEWIH